mmetsp:Transcript_4724/g.7717  ORF Transcript_4724/g.7717 Transcript_4724/m.7717 type:complete len:206 (+) Transcript_4724:114-731(+)
MILPIGIHHQSRLKLSIRPQQPQQHKLQPPPQETMNKNKPTIQNTPNLSIGKIPNRIKLKNVRLIYHPMWIILMMWNGGMILLHHRPIIIMLLLQVLLLPILLLGIQLIVPPPPTTMKPPLHPIYYPTYLKSLNSNEHPVPNTNVPNHASVNPTLTPNPNAASMKHVPYTPVKKNVGPIVQVDHYVAINGFNARSGRNYLCLMPD